MADQQETPPKKVGSLRDRIAAFEKAGAGGATPAPAPAPRPKPAGFASWKPRPPSPSSPATAETSQATASKPSAGLSASDAKDSIVKGGSLKERMAALQGKGAFGGPPPLAPKPVLEKPKWKPPPVVAAPVDDDDEDDQPRSEQPKLDEIIKSPPPPVSSESSEEKASGEDAENVPASEEGEGTAEADPEEEERQRRAAIAARMARLGGTRVGMAPPIFGKRPPPPPKKRSSVSEDTPRSESSKDVVTSPKFQATGEEPRQDVAVLDGPNVSSPPESLSEAAPISQSAESPPRRLSELISQASTEAPEATSARSVPTSMPVPSVPRRAAPPRKKPSKPTAPPPPVPEPEPETEVADVATDTPSSTQSPKTNAPAEEEIEVTDVTDVSTSRPQSAIDSVPAPGENEEPSKPEAGIPPSPRSKETKQSSVSSESLEDRPVAADLTPNDGTHAINAEAEEEVDEETRRRQVAERIAKMGGVNPFAAPVLPRRQSSASNNLEEATSPPSVSREFIPTPSQQEASHSSTIKEEPLEESDISVPSTPSIENNTKAQSPPPTSTAPQFIQEKEADIGKEETADDDASDYSDEDEDIAGVQQAVPDPRLSEEQLEPLVSEQKHELTSSALAPSVPAPPPRVQSAEAPHRGVPPPPQSESEEETDSDEENEEMSRSQILVPPHSTQESRNNDGNDSNSDSALLQRASPSLGVDTAASPSRNQGSLESSLSDEDVPFAISPPPIGRPAAPFHQPPPVTRALPPTPPQATPPSTHEITPHSSLKVPTTTEILDDDEGDPIDPSFHSPSRRASTIILPPSTPTPPGSESPSLPHQEIAQPEAPKEDQENQEAARRRTIAERMAKLGGIKFGAAPPLPGSSGRQAQAHHQEEESQPPTEPAGDAATEEEEERARKARIAAKMAGMGGMRIGMMPTSFPSRKSHALTDESPETVPPPPTRPPPPPEVESEQDGSEDGVKVEAEESDLEEVRHEDIEEASAPPPPIPSRASRSTRRESSELSSSLPAPSSPPGRPPVPAGFPTRRPSTRTVGSQRRTSGDSGFSSAPTQRKSSAPKQQSEYVMVEEPQRFSAEEAPPPPPNRPAGRNSLPPPARSPPPIDGQDSISSQWELPSIPTPAFEFENDLSMSWTEAEAEDGITPSASSGARQGSSGVSKPVTKGSTDSVQLSSDDLIALWGRVGVQVCEVATTLFDRSKKGLVGDGTFPGFIQAVVDEVPNATLGDNWGYLIYKQLGASVQKRASDIMPGDIVELHDTKFKGHKGIHAYHQTVGADEPVVGVVSEFEPKKSKLRVFQANQHVGQQTVESVSYRLEDLKSGTIQVYRVLEA